MAPDAIDANYWEDAHTLLWKACELDELGEFWELTARMYSHKAVTEVGDGYRARFGKDLRSAAR